MEEKEVNEQSRREFVSKLVATAGAVAVAGLVAGTAGEAEGAVEILKLNKIGMNKFTFDKHKGGFSLVLSGNELGNALLAGGLLPEDANLNKAMITISFTY